MAKFIKEHPEMDTAALQNLLKEAVRIKVAEVRNEACLVAFQRLRSIPYRNWDKRGGQFRYRCRQ